MGMARDSGTNWGTSTTASRLAVTRNPDGTLLVHYPRPGDYYWDTHSGTTSYFSDEIIRKRSEAYKRENERRRKQVARMRDHMDVLTDPRVILLRTWISAPAYSPGGLMVGHEDVEPDWLVTFGVATNIETRELETWMSSPLSIYIWRVDPNIMTYAAGPTSPSRERSLMATWVEVLGSLGDGSERRFASDEDRGPGGFEHEPDGLDGLEGQILSIGNDGSVKVVGGGGNGGAKVVREEKVGAPLSKDEWKAVVAGRIEVGHSWHDRMIDIDPS